MKTILSMVIWFFLKLSLGLEEYSIFFSEMSLLGIWFCRKIWSLLVSAQILFDLLAKSQKSYKILSENTIYVENRYTKFWNEGLDSEISSLLL